MPVLVEERVLESLEVEGVKTLVGIPDPDFVRSFASATS